MIARPVFWRNFNAGESKKLNDILEDANKELIHEMGEVENYLTGILLRFKENAVEYVNAGHSDLICKRAKSGKTEIVKLDDRNFKGMFLGKEFMASTYETLDFTINNGDILVLYTDCLYENKNSNGEEYGYERLKATIGKAPVGSSQEILDYIIHDFVEFVGDDQFDDDLTALILKRISA